MVSNDVEGRREVLEIVVKILKFLKVIVYNFFLKNVSVEIYNQVDDTKYVYSDEDFDEDASSSIEIFEEAPGGVPRNSAVGQSDNSL